MDFAADHFLSSASMVSCPDSSSSGGALVHAAVSNLTSPHQDFNDTLDGSFIDQHGQLFEEDSMREDGMYNLKYFSYGIALPTICGLGIVGNILNLVVLTRPSMKGPAYVYMRAYAVAALLAIVFAIPFSGRILLHNEVGPWQSYSQAFFYSHLELFFGNACLGIGVLMLVALTVERYVAVCRLGRSRAYPVHRTPLIAVALATVAVLLYVPYIFRADVLTCTGPNGELSYRKRENPSFAHSTWWAVYLWVLEVIFKLGPTVIIVHLNCCIIIAYRRTCAKRRRMAKKTFTPHSQSHSTTTTTNSSSTNVHYTGSLYNVNSTFQQQSGEDSRRFWEERRLMFLLGSTSILFFICTTPQLVLSLMIHEAILKSYSFQVFRAIANILEVANYSITFYIYCLFSRDFRATFLRTVSFYRRKPPAPPRTSL